MGGPSAAIPEFLSPTSINDLLDCPLRLAFRCDSRFAYLQRFGPRAALGIVAHGVAEDVGKGLLRSISNRDQVTAAIGAAWDSHLTGQVKLMGVAWAPAKPPEPTEWPGYHLTRARVFSRAIRNAFAKSHSQPIRHDMLLEKTLTDEARRIRGRPDRVEGPPGDRCIVDLKTGVSQAQPTIRQRRQLLVYAHLVEVKEGVLPKRMAIENAIGRRWEEPVAEIEVRDIVALARERRFELEVAVAEAVPESLAAPDKETCRWCPYRVCCPSYWSGLELSWDHGSVAGTVTHTVEGRADGIVAIDATSPVDDKGRKWILSRTTGRRHDEGSVIAVVDAERTEAPRHLKARWSTVIE